MLSGFVASSDERFYGGEYVKKFEEHFAESHCVNHGVSFNSATSAIIAAIGALNLCEGDEVIVPAQTMSATAASLMAFNLVPVFADVETETFGIDPKSIEEKITTKTKAIMVVHLYGHPARMDEILKIAKKFDLKIIEDCAQAPLAKYKNRFVGSFGDIGVFSFNYHKHVNCGEGGIAITNNSELKERMCLIRNHGEVKGSTDESFKALGWNFRLTELQAGIAFEQTKKMPELVNKKRELSRFLTSLLTQKFEWVKPPVELPFCESSYYDYPMIFNFDYIGLSKEKFIEITAAENLPITESYKPLYWQSLYSPEVNLKNKICINAEDLFNKYCLTFEVCSYNLNKRVMSNIFSMFKKIEQSVI